MSHKIFKMKVDDFRLDNWNAGFNDNFFGIMESQENVDAMMKMVIGWFPSSQLRVRPRLDEDYIAIYIEDDTWCHLPVDYLNDKHVKYFEKYRFEGLKIK